MRHSEARKETLTVSSRGLSFPSWSAPAAGPTFGTRRFARFFLITFAQIFNRFFLFRLSIYY
jgi:hypothetical protein